MRSSVWLSLALLASTSSAALAGVIHVTDFSSLSAAINSANVSPDSTIYLAPGVYSGGALPNILASVTLAIETGSQAGSAILNTIPTGEKGILTIPTGASPINLTVDGLTFENASISDADGGNGAGIRDQSSGAAFLLVTNSFFLNNQDGILTGDGEPNQDQLLMITVSNSLFANNGNDHSDPSVFGREHAIYAFGQSLTVSGTTFCGTLAGHDIKSRTAVTTVTNSVFYDGVAPDAADPNYDSRCGVGSASYSIDAPNGGQVSTSGNQFFQGPATGNPAIISYGEEGVDFAQNSLSVDSSAFASTSGGIGIQELPNCIVPVQLSSTTFTGVTPVSPPGCSNDVVVTPPQPVDEPATGWIFLMALAAGAFAWRRPRFSLPLLRA